jgi:hypothetical protein
MHRDQFVEYNKKPATGVTPSRGSDPKVTAVDHAGREGGASAPTSNRA